MYVAAFAAQIVADFVPNAIRSFRSWGISLLDQAKAMRMSVLVDAALAPVGLAVAISSGAEMWGFLAVLPLVGHLHRFAREQQRRLDHALALSGAYRATAMLLGEMIEADDACTGSHSRDVVDLVLGVCDRLGVDARTRRHAELSPRCCTTSAR